MHTSVELQEPFLYSLPFTLGLIGLVLLPILIYVIYKLIKYKPKKRVKKVKPPKPVKPVPVNVELVKKTYLNKIDLVKQKYHAREIDEREAYIQLSSLVRNFVHEITGIDAQNLTLYELKALDMPELYNLIERFYSPEFSYKDNTTSIEQSFADARSVVILWK